MLGSMVSRIGHAAANMIPIVASNRIGVEKSGKTAIKFFGNSFVTNEIGEVCGIAGDNKQEIITSTFDLDFIDQKRIGHLNYRDRRPECYDVLLSKDGNLINY